MSDQIFLYNDSPYNREHEARIIGKSTDFGIKLDEPIFYPKGGGQPGDSGTLLVNSHHFKVIETVKDPEGQVYLKFEDADAIIDFEVGTKVTQILNWDTRYKYMRTHTALHLLSVCLPFPVTGGQITLEKGRVDFDMPELPDKDEVTDRLNAMVERDYTVSYDLISQEELRERPQLIKTMSVKPPQNVDFVRLVRIGNSDTVIDLQPCGGTHVQSTVEIGKVFISKIEKKGRMNRRVSVVLQD
ncbi:MAG: alanyl-tRNA editing protein [Paracoccaceae bacterium]